MESPDNDELSGLHKLKKGPLKKVVVLTARGPFYNSAYVLLN
jgi:hypothetical protein